MNNQRTDASSCAETVPPETVYLMYCGGKMKIGFTTNLLARLNNIRNMAALQVDLIAAFPGNKTLERALHRTFKDDRGHGEWFRLSDDIRAFVRFLDDPSSEYNDVLGPPSERLQFAEDVFAGKFALRSPVRL